MDRLSFPHHRSFPLRVLLPLTALLLMPGAGAAFTVGELDLQSAPGQPFRAELPIHGLGEEQLTDARLGSPSDYQLLRLPRHSLMNDLDVSVFRDGKTPKIVITSQQPVPGDNYHLLFIISSDQQRRFPHYPIPWQGLRATPSPARAPAVREAGRQSVAPPPPAARPVPPAAAPRRPPDPHRPAPPCPPPPAPP
ncbi:MAG: hypothetical protein HQL82_16430, partial [Magnetococcales bacterium]|nr:hypothetical protein [Magnetococcales bacterium]